MGNTLSIDLWVTNTFPWAGCVTNTGAAMLVVGGICLSFCFLWALTGAMVPPKDQLK